jgi:hypothetical protein
VGRCGGTAEEVTPSKNLLFRGVFSKYLDANVWINSRPSKKSSCPWRILAPNGALIQEIKRTQRKRNRPVSLAAEQKSHRPGRPLALSLRALGTCTGIISQTNS